MSMMDNIMITDIKTITCAPQPGCNLLMVKVETNQPGLFGWGCATFTQRYLTVQAIIRDYIKPLMIGRNALNIEDNWNLVHQNAYWRNGPIMNNALSGVDQALWDILGKASGMPVWQLLGGKTRIGVPVYRHIKGKSPEEIADRILQMREEEGLAYFRCQMNAEGTSSYGGCQNSFLSSAEPYPAGVYCDARSYLRSVSSLLEFIRLHVGWEVELLHDAHERLSPNEALQLAKMVEPYKLFYLEDLLSPDQTEWLSMIRSQCATPLAIGELFNHIMEYKPLITERLIDYIRCHISQIGGLTPARKLAAFAEIFGVKTAWHGPGDVSPFGHACNVHLSLASSATGILEWYGIDRDERICELFSGIPKQVGNYVYANDQPGWGIEFYEEKAKKYPADPSTILWTQTRLPDGSLLTP